MKSRIYFKLFKYIIKAFNIIILSLLTILVLFLANGYMEMNAVNVKFNEFKNRATLVDTIKINGQTVRLHIVHKEYDFESTENFIFDPYDITKKYYLGSIGDIVVTNRNPMRNHESAIVRDVAGYFSNSFFVGHGTCNLDYDGKRMIESVFSDDYDGVVESVNDWINSEVRHSNDAQMFVGLRAKRLNKEKANELVSELKKCIGCAYNPIFLIRAKDKYYCTDLISRCYERIGININYDGFFPTGYDFILSDELYLIFICERIDDYFNIYYLGGE